MKKLLCFVLAAMLMMVSASAFADTILNPTEKRGIQLQKVGDNTVEAGISPTTGRTLSTLSVPEGFTGMAKTGRYLPMMATIGNDDGGVGNRAPWGAAYADVVYETLLYRASGPTTRLLFVFNDIIPDSLGPIRSVRVTHVWLREEWGAAFMYHGQQTYDGSSAVEEFRLLGHDYIFDPLLFNGWAGAKDWERYFTRRSGTVSPYNRNVNPVGIYHLVDDSYVAPNHTYKFTDEIPEGDPALNVTVTWRGGDRDNVSGSSLIYDATQNAYLRYMRYGNELRPWTDRDEGSQIAFANVIVQFTKSEFNHRRDAPIQRVIGKDLTAAEGNADFFMGGKHVSGYWKRDSATDRTIFYGPDGDEVSLQRGKTLIIIFPDDNTLLVDDYAPSGSSVSYSDKLP